MPGSHGPQVKLAELREYVSGSGRTYFAGYMGRTRLVLFKDQDAECTGREVGRWSLLVEEAPPRDERPALASSPAPARAQPARTSFTSRKTQRPGRKSSDARAAASLRERGIEPGSPMQDDEIGF